MVAGESVHIGARGLPKHAAVAWTQLSTRSLRDVLGTTLGNPGMCSAPAQV
jgi:hypothetical protein